MAISGSLKDVSVADVMQFIHLGRRTGTLVLARGGERAMIGFHGGRLVSAQAPHTPKLGDLLVSFKLIDRPALDEAVQRQGKESPELRRSLGQMLLSSGAIDAEGLRQVIAQQIEQAVSEVMIWDTGTFEFAIDDLRPIDDIALYPGDVLPDADINTQMVLLEAARIFDERNRGREGEGHAPIVEPTRRPVAHGPNVTAEHSLEDTLTAFPAAPREAAPAEEPERIRLQIVTRDHAFAQALAEKVEPYVAGVDLVTADQAGEALPGEPPPLVAVDLRGGQTAVESLKRLRHGHPRASVIALVDAHIPLAQVFAAGILMAMPAEAEAVSACVQNVLATRSDLHRPAPPSGPAALPPAEAVPPGGGVAKLRRVFGDLRSGLISATVALNLMHIISESVERAVLFLVKRQQLVALGAFGVDERGRSLAELTRGLRLELDGDNIFTRSLELGEVQSMDVDEAALPPHFHELVGRSKNGQVVVFPVLGTQRVISMIYADNGDRDQPIEDIDILELATAQVGMAFENELLRRQIQGRDD